MSKPKKKTEPAAGRARTGKVAQLPFTIREQLNLRLRDGSKGPKLLAWLNDAAGLKGSSKISANNLSQWRRGGYEDWLAKLETVENQRFLAEYSLRLAREAGGDFNAGSAAIAGGKILAKIETTEPEELGKVVSALVKLRMSDAFARRVQLAERRENTRDRALALEERRFETRTAELFLKWARNPKVQTILDSKQPDDLKVSDLRSAIFGDPTAPAAVVAGDFT